MASIRGINKMTMLLSGAGRQAMASFERMPETSYASPHPAGVRRGKLKHRGNHISTPGQRRG